MENKPTIHKRNQRVKEEERKESNRTVIIDKNKNEENMNSDRSEPVEPMDYSDDNKDGGSSKENTDDKIQVGTDDNKLIENNKPKESKQDERAGQSEKKSTSKPLEASKEDRKQKNVTNNANRNSIKPTPKETKRNSVVKPNPVKEGPRKSISNPEKTNSKIPPLKTRVSSDTLVKSKNKARFSRTESREMEEVEDYEIDGYNDNEYVGRYDMINERDEWAEAEEVRQDTLNCVVAFYPHASASQTAIPKYK